MANRNVRGRLKKPVVLKFVLKNSFKTLGIAGRVKEIEVIGIWNQIVGHNIARATMPTRIIGKTLYVTVVNSAWMDELQYHKNNIIDKLNKHIEDCTVSDIIFKIGHIDKPCRSPQPIKVRKGSLSHEDKMAIERLTAPLKNKELKNLISEVIAKQKCSMKE